MTDIINVLEKIVGNFQNGTFCHHQNEKAGEYFNLLIVLCESFFYFN